MTNGNGSITTPLSFKMELLNRFNTRAFIAIMLTISMVALTFVLALRGPETDAFKVLLGAMLTVGFASAIGWYFNSSLGSEKKDDIQAVVAGKLADKVAAAPASPAVASPVVVAWWGTLDAAEQAALSAAAATDPKVQAFIDAAKGGKATPEDLAYLVSKIPPLLSQARADAIQAA